MTPGQARTGDGGLLSGGYIAAALTQDAYTDSVGKLRTSSLCSTRTPSRCSTPLLDVVAAAALANFAESAEERGAAEEPASVEDVGAESPVEVGGENAEEGMPDNAKASETGALSPEGAVTVRLRRLEDMLETKVWLG